jgi:putative DNA primase/helicase
VTANDDAAMARAERAAIEAEGAPPGGPGITDPSTDIANGDRMVAWHGSDFRHVSTWGKNLVWTGKIWRVDEAGVQRLAIDTSRRMLSSALDAHREAVHADAAAKSAGSSDDAAESRVKRANAAIKWAVKSQSSARIGAMVSIACTSPRVSIAHDLLDADPWLLNVANGTIDLRSGGLRPHRREDHCTKIAPVAYDPTARAPTWFAFLDRAMAGDPDLLGFLRRAVGYSMTGAIGEHSLLFNFGTGANGKSTFFGTIHRAFGEYASAAPRGLLFTSKGEQHPTELASLHGARFVTCAEIEEDRTFDEAKIKDLTGGDVIEVRRMREDFWRLSPTHKLWLAGNHKPRVRGTDEGIWRRIKLIPWLVQIPPEERDRDLPARLVDELPGVLAWAVRGCLEWQRDGLGEPAAVRAATEAYREESDPLGEFFALRCVFAPDAKLSRKMLRFAYEAWADENGVKHPIDAKRFGAALRARGIVPVNVWHEGRTLDGWRGVRLATDRERDQSLAQAA